MSLSKEQILGKTALRTKSVEVPEWGGAVTVRELTLLGRAECAELISAVKIDKKGATKNVKEATEAKIFVALNCVVDGDGEPMFTREEIEAFGAEAMDALNTIFDAALELGAITDAAVEEAEKNSGPGRS